MRRWPTYRDVAAGPGGRGPHRRRLGGAAAASSGAHARAVVRRHAQPVGALSGAGLPDVGALGALPEQRRLRLPRPAPGRDGVRLRRAGARARAHPARGGAPVRRGRRAALVAPAERARRAHPILRRSRLAAVRRRPLRPRHRRRPVLDEQVPFLAMRALEPDEHEVYDLPAGRRGARRASTSTACARSAGRAPPARTGCRSSASETGTTG